MSVTTTTKIAGRRVNRDEAGEIATKIAALLEKSASYGTASIDVTMTAQWRRYGSSAADKVDATVRIVTD